MITHIDFDSVSSVLSTELRERAKAFFFFLHYSYIQSAGGQNELIFEKN